MPSSTSIADATASRSVIYDVRGHPCAVAFRKLKIKPDWRLHFPNDEARNRRIAEHFEAAAAVEAAARLGARSRTKSARSALRMKVPPAERRAMGWRG
ncbi:hypothetical protein [Bosea caraganae]|uniref:hypothetical protein n=1 Tax=Bosea caraganae TaxID=2763117 RepID=UPI0011C01D7D|nr:hypothetical protein [Bosea caraganae]